MLKAFKKFGSFLRGSTQPTEHALSSDEKSANSFTGLESGEDVQEITGSNDLNRPGMSIEYKRVDEIFDHKTNQWTMRDGFTPKRAQAKRSPYDRYAFTVVRTHDMHSKLSQNSYTTTIDIKSEYLQKTCEEVIGKIQGLSWTVRPLRINPQIILAFLPQLQQHADALAKQDSKTEDHIRGYAHLKLLINFMRTEHAETLAQLSGLLAHGEITFDLLWALLLPRTLVFLTCPTTGAPRIARVIHAQRQCSGGQTYLQIDTDYVERNAAHRYRSGSNAVRLDSVSELNMGGAAANLPEFGLSPLRKLTIFDFSGTASITSLPCFPLSWHPHAEELRTRLVARGRRWRALQGVHHMYYKGTAFHAYNGKINIDSRVMIDWDTFAQINPNYILPNVKKTLNGVAIDKHTATYEPPTASASLIPCELDESDLLLSSPIVYGFSLADKLWLEFDVDHVQSFEWNDEPFANLVLPASQKTLVRSLVEAHSENVSGFDDFVKGKGRGLVINLFGKPGVGKSLTAEATSEHVRRPLYIVGAGDLGTSAPELDASLTRIFSVSANWGAVVLIDEADVFLEERSLHDLKRNAVVAVFLRQLEYFRGILFLTTNRVRTFDEAFQSRIHVSLRYADLTADARCTIWTAFLSKAEAGRNLSDEEILALGKKDMNGRQIKNAVRTADALARTCGDSLGYPHLLQVLEMMDQFEIDRRTAA